MRVPLSPVLLFDGEYFFVVRVMGNMISTAPSSGMTKTPGPPPGLASVVLERDSQGRVATPTHLAAVEKDGLPLLPAPPTEGLRNRGIIAGGRKIVSKKHKGRRRATPRKTSSRRKRRAQKRATRRGNHFEERVYRGSKNSKENRE
jgi:hypothetical protein